MATRDEVRSYQRRMADLDTACQRARHRLEAVQARRAEVISHQDGLVDQARLEWQAAVAALVRVFGPDATAAILGLEAGEIARAMKATSAARDTSSAR